MRFRTLTAAGASAILAFTITACGADNRDMNDEPGAVGTTGADGLTVAAIQENPERYIGQKVTLEAEVDRVVGPRAFYLDEDAPVAGGIDNDLLVLSRMGGAAEASRAEDQWGDDERVRVTGQIARVSVVELERDLAWDFTPELEIELGRRQVVLIADLVQRIER